jgi:hypothetical protein
MPLSAATIFSETCLVPAKDPDLARMLSIRLKASVTYRAGEALSEVGGTGGVYQLYVDSTADPAQLLLKYACQTDASGNITYGAGTAGDEHGITHLTVPAYYKGCFKTEDLPQSGAGQLDTNGLADLKGRLLEGSLVTGLIEIG